MDSVPCVVDKINKEKLSGDSTPKKQPKTRNVEGPDGRSAWMVALAACLINFIMAGLGRVSGILYVAFIELYGVDRKLASTPFSVRSSAGNLLGPVVGILGEKYGARSITMIGGITATFSAASCFFATDITWITFLWGGLNGLGNALTVTLPQVVIGQYFDEYKTTASGMAFSGACLGSFVFPVLLEHLLEDYGIEGTFLSLAAIIMHTIPAAMIMKKPSWLKTVKRKDPDEIECLNTLKSKLEHPDDVESPRVAKSTKMPKGNLVSTKTESKFFLKKAKCLNLKIIRQNMELVVRMLSIGESMDMTQEFRLWSEIEDMLQEIEHSNKKPRFYQNISMAKDGNCFEKQACALKGSNGFLDANFGVMPRSRSRSAPDLSSLCDESTRTYVLSKLKKLDGMKPSHLFKLFPKDTAGVKMVARQLGMLYNRIRFGGFESEIVPAAETSFQESSPSKTRASRKANSFLDHIKTAVRLHSNPLFLMICFCRAVHFVAFIPVMTIVVDFVMDKGLLEQDGKYAIAALSVGDLVGRLCFGWVTDRGFLSIEKYMMLVMMIQGASTASLPLMHTKATLFTTLAAFGMLQGSLFVRHPVLVSKYMGRHEQSIAMGCINFISGLLGFGLPSYIGYFRDTLGTYDYIFYINGTVGALIGLMWVMEPYFRQCVGLPKISDEGLKDAV